MRKLTTIGMMILMLGMSIPTMGAMSNSRMRKEARFLTDRMAYELGLNAMQYDDVYEVNYDFLNGVRYLMDDVVRGYGYAIDRYYNCTGYFPTVNTIVSCKLNTSAVLSIHRVTSGCSVSIGCIPMCVISILESRITMPLTKVITTATIIMG